jgi:hypothetical protein
VFDPDPDADTEGAGGNAVAWERGVSVAPLGLGVQRVRVPRLTPWAIIFRPSGPGTRVLVMTSRALREIRKRIPDGQTVDDTTFL